MRHRYADPTAQDRVRSLKAQLAEVAGGTVTTRSWPSSDGTRMSGSSIPAKVARRRRGVLLAVLLLGCGATASVRSAAEPLRVWRYLFDGANLGDWRAPVAPETWSVRDGVLVATPGQTGSHLFFVGRGIPFERFRDFELEALVKGGPEANSGIFFHTDFATAPGSARLAAGYEVQLCKGNVDRRKTGSLYDIVDLLVAPLSGEDWFRVRIVVRGQRIGVWIKETQVVDYTEPPDAARTRSELRPGRVLRPLGGAIALQAHGGHGAFYFRWIRIRTLPAVDAGSR
jgi:hypothetical protein